MKGSPAHQEAIARLARSIAAETTPEKRLLREAVILLRTLQDALQETEGTLPVKDAAGLSVECYALRVKLQNHLGDLVNWRNDIRVPRPAGAGA